MRTTKGTIRFSSRKQSVKGIFALVIAAVTVIATGVLMVAVTGSGGNSGMLTGVFALLLMAASAAGFVLALKSLYERDVLSVLPVTALLLNGFVVIFYLCMYIIGF